jgi:dihydrofolate reductase
MRKVILNVAVSLDGFIEGPKGEFDWCFTDQDYGMTDFMNRIDAIFFGRKSYELVLKKIENPFSGKDKYVFSKTMTSTGDETHIIDQNVKTEVKRIQNQKGKDIWLFGGAELISLFMNYGLVDELQLAVHPLLLGKGKPLFMDLKKRTDLALTRTKTFSSGLIQLIYEFAKK